jgi:hypothetical protein
VVALARRLANSALHPDEPTPEVLDEVTLEGRFGIVLSRLDVPTLM